MITPCIRCGKMRIVSKKWSEPINGSKTIYTLSVCPDADCQKMVDKELEKRQERAREMQIQSLKRRNNLRNKGKVVAKT